MPADLTPAQKLMVEDGLPAELLVPQEKRDADWKGRRTKATKTFAALRPAKEVDPGTAKLLAERKAAERAAEKRKNADRREAAIIKAKQKIKPAAEAATQETIMKKTSTKPKAPAKPKAKIKATKKAKKASSSADREDGGVRPGSKLEIIVGLLTRPEGCTTADVLAATDWPAVSMPQQAKAAGLKLVKEKDGKVTRYRAAAAA